jgi:DNA (cytosine-5)-methyltransferase 3A
MGWELFSQYVRALHEAQPMWFIYENNKSMSNAIRESISDTFGFEPICINSALVSAQNRQRLYWVGRRNPDGTYSRVRVDQPEDRGILLRDVLGHAVALREKANCLCGNRGGTSLAHDLEKAKHNYAAEPVASTVGQKIIVPVRVGTWPNEAKNQAHDSQQYRIYSTDAKGVALCGNGGGIGAKTGLYAIPVELDGEVPIKAVSPTDGTEYPVYQVRGGKITIKGKQYPIKLADGFYIIRKLTVTECKRLQTVPEWYEFPVSDTQAYKMLGNGWTVEVIAHLINATQAGELEEEQLDLFRMWGDSCVLYG